VNDRHSIARNALFVAVAFVALAAMATTAALPGTLMIWGEPFTCMRIFKIFNLHMDPFERADITSNTYWEWNIRHAYFGVPGQQHVAGFATFKEYPPSQRAPSFSIDQIMEKLQKSLSTTQGR